MDYLAFRYTKTKYKVPILYNDKVQHADPERIFFRLLPDADALFLSGGLDSSLLAALSKERGYNLKQAYTAKFPGYTDEYEWAARVAEHLKINLTSVMIDQETYLSVVRPLIKHKGDGLHPNEPCLYLMAKQAVADGHTTIMSGEGADGLFGGYTDLYINEDKYMKDEETFLERYCYINTQPKVPFKKWKKWGMYRFLLEVHTPALIDRAMNACDLAGIEVKFPYLEYGIPQMMWEAPMGQKIDKPILKEIAEKYLPRDIVWRKKVGFPVPFMTQQEFLRYNKEVGWT